MRLILSHFCASSLILIVLIAVACASIAATALISSLIPTTGGPSTVALVVMHPLRPLITTIELSFLAFVRISLSPLTHMIVTLASMVPSSDICMASAGLAQEWLRLLGMMRLASSLPTTS